MVTPVQILPDYACQVNGNGRKLSKVGIKNYAIYRMDFSEERVLTDQSAYVRLGEANGVHMSRLVETLEAYEGELIAIDSNIIEDLATSHGVDNSYWSCKWDSLYEFEENQRIKVRCGLEANLIDFIPKWYLTVNVPYASVCPCSAQMTKQEGGIPHMQRATAVVTGLIENHTDLDMLLSTTISRVINAVGLIPMPLMKRVDELRWCQHADEVNLFVEDACREVANVIDGWFNDWVIVCEHEESIHQHNVLATCNAGKTLK